MLPGVGDGLDFLLTREAHAEHASVERKRKADITFLLQAK
jgi:hypothetical protein